MYFNEKCKKQKAKLKGASADYNQESGVRNEEFRNCVAIIKSEACVASEVTS